METKIITKADLNYRNEYAASTDLRFAGHLTFEADLGWVRILGTLAVDGCIVAKAVTCKLRIFAGLCLYRLPKPEEGQIRVTRPVQGTVCFGEVVVEPVKAKG